MKYIYLFIVCDALVVSNLLCMDDSQNNTCPRKGQFHAHECAITGRPSDWNCFGKVTDQLSLRANKIWLMTLFSSVPYGDGTHRHDPGPFHDVYVIEGRVQEINQTIVQMRELATDPERQKYLKRCNEFFNQFFQWEKSWAVQKSAINEWMARICSAGDLGCCQQLEKEFIEIYKPNICYFNGYFSLISETVRKHYLSLLAISSHDNVGVKIDSNDQYALFFHELVSASLMPDRSYFDSLIKIIGAIVDFHMLQECQRIIFSHLTIEICYEKSKKIDPIMGAISQAKQLINFQLGKLLVALECGALRKTVKNYFLVQTLMNPIETYEDNLMALRKLIYPPTSSYRMLPIPTPNISKVRKGVPILKLDKLPCPSLEQCQNLPPLSS